jgi:16S rRNA (uracil1498-N3)-methyltransferase
LIVRRLVVPTSIISQNQAQLSGPLHHYVCHVLRLKPNDPLEIADGQGTRYLGRIIGLDAKTVRVALDHRIESPPSLGPRLVLIYGLSRRSHTELVLQKTTELGVDWILPSVCQRSVSIPPNPERKLERWKEIIVQASRQCGRSTLPFISVPAAIESTLTEASGADIRWIATEQGTPLSTFSELSKPHSSPQMIALAVGPEGGFTEEELQMAIEMQYEPVKLGPLTLRTETAAIVAVALAAFLSGRFNFPEGGR